MTYGGCKCDYPVDYIIASGGLFANGYDYDVVLSIAGAAEHSVLILATAAILSDLDRVALAERKGGDMCLRFPGWH